MPTWRRRQPAAPVAPGLAAVVRGAWLGFAVLFVGDLATLYRGRGSGLILYWVAAAAYAVAGNRAGRPSGAAVRTAARDGAGAAVCAYLLTVPLRLAAGRVPGGAAPLGLVAAVVAGGAAVVVGAAAGAIAARTAGRRPPAPPAVTDPHPQRAGAPGHSGASEAVRARASIEPRWPVTRGTAHLPDGRRMQYISAGPADAPPLVLHHATPGAVGAWRGAVATAARAGLRVVVASRPGYGGSDPLPGRRVADTAADVAALLDHLGAEVCVTLGWAAGGPHALACAALLPERCLAAAVVAGLAPCTAAGLDWPSGMAADAAAEYELAVASPADLEGALAGICAGYAGITADGVAEAAGALAEADQRVLAGPFADYLAATYRAGVAGGPAGWRDDDLALVGPWGFELAAVGVPVGVWWGEDDLVVPPAHGRWLASAVPLGRGSGRPGEGHLSVLPHCFEEVVAALAPAVAGRPPAPPARPA